MQDKFVILLVDDNKAILSLYTDILEKSGYHVISKTDGWNALDAMEREGDRIDVVLTDIRMPGMDGYELTRRIKTERPYLPVIAHSGIINRQSQAGRFARIFDNYLIKPCPAEEMLASIEAALPELVY